MYDIPLYPFSKATRVHIQVFTVPQERALSAQSGFLSKILHESPFSKRIPKIFNVHEGPIKLFKFYQNKTTKLTQKGLIQTHLQVLSQAEYWFQTHQQGFESSCLYSVSIKSADSRTG